MTGNWIQKIATTAAAVFLLGGYLDASSNAFKVIEKIPDRIYVQQNQIRLNSSCIGVAIEGRVKEVQGVFKDKCGYYYEEHHKSCPNCHDAVTITGDCAISDCAYYYDGL